MRTVKLLFVTIMAMIFIISVCSCNTDQIGKRLQNVGIIIDEALNGTHIDESFESHDEIVEITIESSHTGETDVQSEEERITPTPTNTPTPSPTPTASPTPSPTPVPYERVDFSQLLTYDVSEDFVLHVEKFEQTQMHGEVELGSLGGQRIAIHSEVLPNVSAIINADLNYDYIAFESMYDLKMQEQIVDYTEDMVIEHIYDYAINYSYTISGRILTIVTNGAVTTDDDQETVIVNSITSYDLYNGDIINIEDHILDDVFLEYMAETYEGDAEIDADEIEDIYIVSAAGENVTIAYKIEDSDSIYYSEVPAGLMNSYLTRYGQTLLQSAGYNL